MIAEVLEKLSTGQALNPVEMDRLRNFGKETENTNSLVGKWVKPGTNLPIFYSDEREGQPAHSVTYIRNALAYPTFPPSVWKDIDFNDKRTYIKPEESCVIQTGDNYTFKRNPQVPNNRSILTLAFISFDLGSSTIEQGFDLALDTYMSGSYWGSVVFHQNWHRWFPNYTSLVLWAHGVWDNTQTMKLSGMCWNDAAKTVGSLGTLEISFIMV